MKCYIQGHLVEAKIIENLGFRNGRHVKIVKYEGEEYVVVRLSGGLWIQAKPEIQFKDKYKGGY